ncbi:hypothetical protein [uncultured Parolsenella sp.]|uniref:hypothetical protein n=1 Tax=uncultured Parolsenella sp. TaxID=2083008 RepID=UPI0027DB8E95|nr:hypothetical protein [uncultured Parolsenella sp.]
MAAVAAAEKPRAVERDSGISALDHARAAVDGFCEHLGLPQGEPLFDEGENYKDIYADYLMERYYPEDGGDR